MTPEVELQRAGACSTAETVTVLQARLYCDSMRRIEAAKTSGQAVRENLQLLADFFNTSRRIIYSASVDDLLLAAKLLHFTMQQIVLPKFAVLSPEPPEPIVKSIFDDYDADQDALAGYVDETADRWLICKQNVEAVTRLAIRVLRESYTDAQREPLGRLLEYVAYEIEHTEK